MDSLELMSLKDYAEIYGCGLSPLYRKIKRNNEQLKEHIFKVGGKKMIDKYAQEFLKPSTTLIKEQEKQIEELSKIVGEKSKKLKHREKETRIKILEKENEKLLERINKYEIEISNLKKMINNIKQILEKYN